MLVISLFLSAILLLAANWLVFRTRAPVGMTVGLSLGLALGLFLWLFGWWSHRFWVVLVTTVLAGLFGLNEAPRLSANPIVLSLLALSLAAFVAGHCRTPWRPAQPPPSQKESAGRGPNTYSS